MKKRIFHFTTTVFVTGFAMWILAGIWHNLILPSVNSDIHPHHEGLFLGLIAYWILAGFIAYFFSIIEKKNFVYQGIKIGILIGILWVFPHGLAMAGVHHTSIVYEFKNTFWHIIEQGFGGFIVGFISKHNRIFG